MPPVPCPPQTLFSGAVCDLAFDSWGVPWFVAWAGGACGGIYYYKPDSGTATQVGV